MNIFWPRVWKRIQQNTFTRWANEHLKTVHQTVMNLETDLDDGLRLISLLQVLSGKLLPKHNKKPNFRSQKLENVSVALSFLEKDEGIKIVNIGTICNLEFPFISNTTTTTATTRFLLHCFITLHLYRLEWYCGLQAETHSGPYMASHSSLLHFHAGESVLSHFYVGLPICDTYYVYVLVSRYLLNQ